MNGMSKNQRRRSRNNGPQIDESTTRLNQIKLNPTAPTAALNAPAPPSDSATSRQLYEPNDHRSDTDQSSGRGGSVRHGKWRGSDAKHHNRRGGKAAEAPSQAKEPKFDPHSAAVTPRILKKALPTPASSESPLQSVTPPLSSNDSATASPVAQVKVLAKPPLTAPNARVSAIGERRL